MVVLAKKAIEGARMIDLTNYLWILWLVLILIFLVVELLTLDLTFLMIAAGSVGGLATTFIGAPWWLQILVTGALSTLLLFSIRPTLLRRLARGADPRPTNVAGLIGFAGVTVSALDESGGLVKLANGETWTARLRLNDPPHTLTGQSFASGTSVIVTAIEGSTAVVDLSERKIEQ